jgi:hypothetical protein
MQHVCNTTFVIDIYTRFALTQWRLALDKALSLLSHILSPYRCALKRSDGAYLGIRHPCGRTVVLTDARKSCSANFV